MRWPAMFVAVITLFAGRAEASCSWRPGELFKISGDVHQGKLSGSFSRTVAPASGRFVEAIDLGILRSGSGFDGRLAWSRDVSGATHYLNSQFARRLAVSEAWLSSKLGCGVPERSSGATHVGVDRTSGLDIWRFSPRGGAPVELWYNLRSGHLDRAILQYSENRLIHHYGQWREITAGRFLPFSRRDEDPEDESESDYRIRHVVPARTASFRPPPAPNDSKILAGRSTKIPYEDDGRRRIFLPLYLNGKGPFTFELDNGSHFILTEETAKALGLAAKGSFSSTGAGNQIATTGYVMVDKLRIGSAELVKQPAKVLALSHNDRGGSSPRAGILGLEFFERFVVGVDHRRKIVTLRLVKDPPSRHLGRAVPLLFDEDAPLVAGSYEGVPGMVMLDIGNAGATIVEDYWAGEHGLRPKLSAGVPKGSAKLSKARIGLGPFVLEDETAAYLGQAERGSEYTRSVAAIIGEPLLSRFDAVYDYGHRTVWLDPIPGAGAVDFDLRR